jgi:TrmH family RNA methyltransferase
VIEAADERVTIPMAPRVESLNTAVTAGILVYEALRQRRRRRPVVPHVVI